MIATIVFYLFSVILLASAAMVVSSRNPVHSVLFIELALVLGGWKFAPDVATLRLSPAPAQVSNTAALGRLLYTDYVFLFQAAGLLLLVAMIGAIVLTLRDRKTSRHQSIRVQTERTVAETLEMVTMTVGAGVKDVGIFVPQVAEPEPVEEAPHGH